MTTILRPAAILLAILVFNAVGAWAGGEAVRSAPAAEESQEDFSTRIIWIAEQPEKPRFIPEAQLQANRRLNLPLDKGFEFWLDRAKTAVAPGEALKKSDLPSIDASRCSVSSHSSTGDPSEPSLGLLPYLKRNSFVFRGDVIQAVSGWSAGEVQTLLYMRVNDIVWCRVKGGRSVSVGDTVAVAVRRGRIVVDGRSLCNATDSIDIPAVGEDVLVSTHPLEGYSYYTGLGLIFPVREDLVISQPYAHLERRGPQPLAQVLSELESGIYQCGG